MYTIFDEYFDDELIDEFKEPDICNFLSQLNRQAQNFLRNTKMPPTFCLRKIQQYLTLTRRRGGFGANLFSSRKIARKIFCT